MLDAVTRVACGLVYTWAPELQWVRCWETERYLCYIYVVYYL